MALTRITCRVTQEVSGLSWIWSDGSGDFDAYRLDGQALVSFRQNASRARQSLRDLVDAFQDSAADRQWECLHELAQAGWELYRGIFRSDRSHAVEEWLNDSLQRNDIASLEIVTSGDVNVPWNAVYGVRPEKDAFGPGRDDPLRHFWGRAYSLASGLRVDPLRRRPLLEDVRILFAGDENTIEELGEPAKSALQKFVREHDCAEAHDRSELADSLTRGPYQLIYWFSHATPEHLYLGADKLSAHDLFELLDSLAKRLSGGIAFLNACRTAQTTSGEQAYLGALIECGLSGIIGTEHEIPNLYANEFGLALLGKFLGGEGPIAELMRDLRALHPLGLLYATCCPPHITVAGSSRQTVPPAAAPAVPLPSAAQPGVLLGIAAAEIEMPLPPSPYVALAAYERSHRALFAGRRVDCDRFASILNAPATRLLLLQGATGVGKTSFLRAEVIPFLERESIGYHFLRRRVDGGPADDESDSSILFVRAGKDVVAELAQAIWDFSATPYERNRPNGQSSVIDLRQIIESTGACAASTATLVAGLRADGGLLHRILHALSAALPFTILLVIDQAEEIFTQDQGGVALAALRQVAAAAEGDYKIIISLRTEYYGRLVNALRQNPPGRDTVREYLLTDFSEDDLVEAIIRPTVDRPIAYATEIPWEKYKFSYAPGLARELAREVRSYAANSQDSVLPLIQVICTQLYERVKRPGLITAGDLKAIGGVSGGMRRHLETLIDTLFAHPADRAGIKHLLTELYVRHPNGTLTTALLPEAELAGHWCGKTPFTEALAIAADPKYRLLKRGHLRLKDGSEERYLSLGHDTLAHVAQVWKRTEQERLRWMKEVAVVLVALGLIALFGYLWWQTSKAKTELAEQNRVIEGQKGAVEEQKGAVEQQKRVVEEQKRVVEEQKRVVNAERLAAKAQVLYARQPDLAVLFAATGNRLVDNLETRSALLTVLESDPRLQTLLPSHSGGVCRVAFNADGSILIAQDCKGDVHFWDLKTAREAFLRVHAGPEETLGLALLPGSSTLAVATLQGMLRFWDTHNARPVRECRFAGKPVGGKGPFPKPGMGRRVAFSQDGLRFAFTEDSREVHLWRLPGCAQEFVRTFPAHVRKMVFSPDGNRLAVSLNDRALSVVDVGSGKKIASALASGDTLWNGSTFNPLAFSLDGSLVGAGYIGGQLTTLPLKGSPERIRMDRAMIRAIAFSGDASLIGVGTLWDGSIRVWDRGRNQYAKPLEAHSSGIRSLSSDPRQGTWASTSDGDRFVALWDLDKTCRLCLPIPDSAGSSSATFSGDSRNVFVLSKASEESVRLAIWTGAGLRPIRANLLDGPFEGRIALSGDGKRMVFASGQEIRLLDAATGEDLASPLYSKNEAPRRLIDIDEAGRVIIFTTISKEKEVTVGLWDGKSSRTLFREPAEILALRMTPDGHALVIVESTGDVVFWDLLKMRESRPRLKEKFARNPSKRAALSRDGRFLVEGENNIIRLWDLRETDPVPAVLVGHSSLFFSFAFSHDGSLLASVGGNTIRLWNVETKQAWGPALHGFGNIWESAFSRDGKRLLSIDSGRGIFLWSLDPAEWQAAARSLVNRNLSRREWQQFVGSIAYFRTFPELPEPQGEP